MDQDVFVSLTSIPKGLGLPLRGSRRMAYSGSPGSLGTASDSFSGFCRPDNRHLHNCTLCHCRGSCERRGASCCAGRQAGHQTPCTCESEACQTRPRHTATSAKANVRASYPSPIPSQVFLIKDCCFCFWNPGGTLKKSQGQKASFSVTLDYVDSCSLRYFLHCRQIQMTTKSWEIRATSMTPEPKN